jgi:uncharacterized membrane-anchored protein
MSRKPLRAPWYFYQFCAKISSDMKIKEAFKVAMKTKSFWLLGLIGLVEVAVIAVMALVSMRTTTVNIPIHYSAYANNFFSDKWYYVIAFIVFAVVVYVAHLFISVKMISSENRALSPVVQFVGDLVLLITLMVVLNIFNIIRLRLQI